MQCTLAKDVARKSLRHGLRELQSAAKNLAGEDVEAVHAARVASRRLRAAIRAHRRAIPRDGRTALAKNARDVTKRLSKARELDVTIHLVGTERNRLSGAPRYAATHTLNRLRSLRAHESAAIEKTAARLAGKKFRRAVDRCLDARYRTKRCYLKEAQAVLIRHLRALWKAHNAWVVSANEPALHETRIAFKKLRYACEQYHGAYGGKMKRLIAELRAAQDELGTWNDYRIASHYARELADGAEPIAMSGVAPLAEWLDDSAARHLATYDTLSRPFFSDEGRSRIERVITRTRRSCCDNKE